MPITSRFIGPTVFLTGLLFLAYMIGLAAIDWRDHAQARRGPSPNQPVYDELNANAERLGLGRPFSGKMEVLDYHLWLGRLVAAQTRSPAAQYPSRPPR